jgi:hypothetical protein
MRARPALVLLLLTASLLLAGAASAKLGPVRGNPADRLASLPIDDYRYDRAHHCRRGPAKGTVALEAWLEGNVLGSSWGIMRCQRLSKSSMSLHSEGRAIDWHLNVRNPRERRAARKLIALLLAPDRAGNKHALGRRMGVQEIIWNCRSWWSGSERMDRYSLCFDRRGKPVRISDTLAHRDHVHIGLTRPGAAMRTSFWRKGR